MRHTAEWPHLAGSGAASQWPVGILPASFAGRPLTFRSHGRDRQTLCSGLGNQNQSFYKSHARVNSQNIYWKSMEAVFNFGSNETRGLKS